MQIKTILRLLGLLLMIFSVSMLTPLIFTTLFKESFNAPFLSAYGVTVTTGFILWTSFKTSHHELKIRDGFLLVVLFWLVICLFGALPFLFALEDASLFTDAIFESVSGFTTTGATIFQNLASLPKSLLFYRQQLQFLGGMGIVVLAVAILPMLGVGGMQLFKAETPGPMKESKMTPRVAQTAKALWSIYVFLTFSCAFTYWLLGMHWFDAIGESFATVSTGGFCMHDKNFAFYQSEALELAASGFMLLGATNFTLHFYAFKKRTLLGYFKDEEFRFFLIIMGLASLIIGLNLTLKHLLPADHHVLIDTLFNVISFATTTGYESVHVPNWPIDLIFILILIALIGGCATSTSGGIKVMRTLLLFKQSRRELKRLLHPHAIVPIKFGGHSLSEPILQSMWGFISVFIALFIVLMIIFIALGHDFFTAFSAIAATLSNLGNGFGDITLNYANLSDPSKWVLIFSMLAGRLEIFSILILFSTEFWRN
jgi:trk system potassium uptake protein TrkH